MWTDQYRSDSGRYVSHSFCFAGWALPITRGAHLAHYPVCRALHGECVDAWRPLVPLSKDIRCPSPDKRWQGSSVVTVFLPTNPSPSQHWPPNSWLRNQWPQTLDLCLCLWTVSLFLCLTLPDLADGHRPAMSCARSDKVSLLSLFLSLSLPTSLSRPL